MLRKKQYKTTITKKKTKCKRKERKEEKKKNRYCLESEGCFVTTAPGETHCEDNNNILL